MRVLLLCLLPVVAWADGPAKLEVDGTRSELVAKLFKAGIAARLAHDHVIAARTVSGTVVYDAKKPAACAIDVTVDAASLKADEPAMRKRYGLKGELSKSDIATIEKTMRGASQLNVAKYKTIRFRSTAARYVKDAVFKGQTWKVYDLDGELTIRGVTKKATVQSRVRFVDGVFTGVSALRFKQSSFGWTPYSTGFGAIKVKDEVALRILVTAVPKKQKAPAK